ncbi:MAG: hypothetical protein GWP10_00115 [Nitrospiraceae bacterium]|nr:hypothetical protein [Nitrospiraceae bacterium]
MTKSLSKDIKTLEAVIEALNASDRFLLTCHIKPDGDALGSLLGLGLALMHAGKDVILFTEKPVPNNLKFLPGTEHIVNEVLDPLQSNTTLVILDCNEPSRIGKYAQRFIEQASSIIILDHHLSPGPFLPQDQDTRPLISYILPDVFAAAALVFWALEGIGWPISRDIATNLYTAILSDTGSFRHSNTNETTFKMAGALVAYGADPYFVANMLYESHSVSRQYLLAMALNTIEIKGHGKIGLIQVTPEMFRSSGAAEQDTEDFVGHVRCIDTVEVAIFIKEAHAGQVSVSLRSKSFFNVAELAREFGGGGHIHAAGFHQEGTASEVKDALLDRLNTYFGDYEAVNV